MGSKVPACPTYARKEIAWDLLQGFSMCSHGWTGHKESCHVPMHGPSKGRTLSALGLLRKRRELRSLPQTSKEVHSSGLSISRAPFWKELMSRLFQSDETRIAVGNTMGFFRSPPPGPEVPGASSTAAEAVNDVLGKIMSHRICIPKERPRAAGNGGIFIKMSAIMFGEESIRE